MKCKLAGNIQMISLDKILALSPFSILRRYEKGNSDFGEGSTKKQKYLSPDVHALIERDVTYK